MSQIDRFSDRFRAHFTVFIQKYAWVIIGFFLILSSFSIYFTVHNLGINSDTADMFDSSLPFRERQELINNLFPLTDDNFLIVIESDIPETSEQITQLLYDELKSQPVHFQDVFVPGGGKFFRENQILFLSEKKLIELSDKLKDSQVFLSLLAQNYSIRGLFTLLDQILVLGNEDQISRLDGLFAQIDSTIRYRLNNGEYTLSWQKVFLSAEESDDGTTRLIQVKPTLDYNKLLPAKSSIEAARSLIERISNEYNADIRMTGKLALNYEEMQSVTMGAALASILALIFVSIVLWIGLRNVKLIAAALITLLVGLSLTLAFSTFAVGVLNKISIAFAVLYIGLGIDYGIHFCLKFNELFFTGKRLPKSIEISIKELSPALFLSCFSTALGFYSFIPTSFNGVSELGLIAGSGMFISLIATFTLLPALICILFRRRNNNESRAPVSAPFGECISTLQHSNAKVIRSIGIVAGLIALLMVPFVQFDYDPINLRDPDSESVLTFNELVKSEIISPWTVEIIYPDSLSADTALATLKQVPLVGSTISLRSFIPDSQQQKIAVLSRLAPRLQAIPPVTNVGSSGITTSDKIEAIERLFTRIQTYDKYRSATINNMQESLTNLMEKLSDSGSELNQDLLLNIEKSLLSTYPLLLERLKEGISLQPVTTEDLPVNLTRRWVTPDNRWRVEIFPEDSLTANNKLRLFANQVQSKFPASTGNLLTTIRSGDTVVHAFIEALAYAFIVITLLLLLYLGSFKDTAFILFPLVLTAFLTGAIMVVINIDFNFANIIALPLLLGLGVDNGVHIVHRFRIHDNSNTYLLQTSTARAILFSSLTTLFSFGNLAFSPHQGTASMGILLTIGLFFLIVSTLFILPAFLINKNSQQI